MGNKRYPVGTKIMYMPNADNVCFTARGDIGKQGTVVKDLGYQVRIHLPTSSKSSKTWRTLWKNMVLLPQKNEQLLFDFAYEEG